MKTLSKPLTYLGVALKANKLRTGINAINTLKSDVYLVVLSKDGEKNAVKEAKKIAGQTAENALAALDIFGEKAWLLRELTNATLSRKS